MPVVPEPAPPVLSRRARRAPASGEQAVLPVPALDEVEVEPLTEAQPVVEIAREVVAPEQPPLLRSRRSRVAPVVHETAEPSLPEAVQAPVEPFQLIEPEPVVVPEPVAPVPVEPAAAVVDTPEPVAASKPVAAPEPVSAPEPAATIPAAEEPIVDEPVRPHTPRAASDVDEFEAAAKLFSFTGQTPVQQPADAPPAPADDETAPQAADAADGDSAHQAPPRMRTRTTFKRIAATSFSVGVMGIVGLMAVGMTVPAEAVAAVQGTDATTSLLAGDVSSGIDEEDIQAYVAPAGTESADLTRSENYGTVTMAEIAAASGIRNTSNFFVNDPTAAIQWPFAVGVPISYGFGMRSGRMHEGVDFTPGDGSPIQAIADGVVREATQAGGAYGVHVIIDHIIDGQLVSSHYAHMQYGSLQVVPGQHVTVGTILGRTGNTGRSYGAHTHFEILANGTTAIDPIPWLRQHAGG
ncbi:peptidoglycan DD-metalloendopeptidase family protein [Microbacterium hominis]|uniref:Peptidoglycan DD-metalloendopeptidase family protein n=1 Tax=Microbacterium hominis TaxID=162426 RepID=A0A7D4QLP2_9MICO|nr:peptidoglycan DD-metalloendopeptidase family protein [Microbacterium hominis]